MPLVILREIDGNDVILDARCERCGKTYGLTVRAVDYLRYLQKTELIQDVFSYLRPPLRELFVSGICPKCWEHAFGGENAGGETDAAAAA